MEKDIIYIEAKITNRLNEITEDEINTYFRGKKECLIRFKHFLKNLRPISLLNVMYTLMSSVIANRLKSVLDKIISNDQKGIISGRYIGENIRTIYDILFETKQQNIPGLMLSVDFQQAFDTVLWKFIEKTLDYVNFGPSIKKWIKLFQTGAQSCILQNGHLSESFTLQRGCRQGDPISHYIFILCVEIVGKMIRNDKKITKELK